MENGDGIARAVPFWRFNLCHREHSAQRKQAPSFSEPSVFSVADTANFLSSVHLPFSLEFTHQTMANKPVSGKSSISADWFMRGALTRIGDAFDRITGRKWTPSSSIATSELIERLKKLLDSEKKEVQGKGFVV